MHIITPVWGDTHTSLFLSFGVPSLLAPGNIPSLKGSGSVFHIYCKKADAAKLEQAPAILALSESCEVKFSTIPDEFTVANHTMMSQCHKEALAYAMERGAWAVFVPPDCIWSENTLDRLAEIAAEPRVQVVHMSGLRLDQVLVRDQLAALVKEGRYPVIAASPRQLVKIALSGLHAITKSHFFEDFEGGLMPANLFWRIGDKAILARCFHLHPLLLKPTQASLAFQSTIDDDLALKSTASIESDYIVCDSDQFVVFEISSPLHRVGAFYKKGSTSDIATWAETQTNPKHRQLIRSTILLKAEDVTPEELAAVAERADGVVNKVLRLLSAGALELLVHNRDQFVSKMQVQLTKEPTLQPDSTKKETAQFVALNLAYYATRPFVLLYAAVRAVAQCIVGPLDRLLKPVFFGGFLQRAPWHPLRPYEERFLMPLIEHLSRELPRNAREILLLDGGTPFVVTLEQDRTDLRKVRKVTASDVLSGVEVDGAIVVHAGGESGPDYDLPNRVIGESVRAGGKVLWFDFDGRPCEKSLPQFQQVGELDLGDGTVHRSMRLRRMLRTWRFMGMSACQPGTFGALMRMVVAGPMLIEGVFQFVRRTLGAGSRSWKAKVAVLSRADAVAAVAAGDAH